MWNLPLIWWMREYRAWQLSGDVFDRLTYGGEPNEFHGIFANRGRNPRSHVLYAWFNALWVPSLLEMQPANKQGNRVSKGQIELVAQREIPLECTLHY